MLQKNNRIETLQVLRSIAFLEIFLGHCGIRFFTGAFGASIFIVLSGFCMAINHLSKVDTQKITIKNNFIYAISKIKGLYGIHLFMLFFAFLLAKMPRTVNAVKRLVMDVLLIQSFSPYSEDYFSYNGVAWYLSVYLFILFISPWIMKFLSGLKRRQEVLLLMAMVFGGMVVIGMFVNVRQIPLGDNFAFWCTYICPLYRTAEFVLGASLGWLYLRVGNQNLKNVPVTTLFEIFSVAAFIGVICIFHKIEAAYPGICYTALFTPVSLLLVSVFASGQGFVIKILNHKILLWLGNLSSYTFLIHQVVIRWLMTILDRKQLGDAYILVLTILSFAVTVIGAELVLFIKKSGGSYDKRISGIRNF